MAGYSGGALAILRSSFFVEDSNIFVSGILIAWNSFQLNKHRQAKRIKQERKRKEEIISAPISQPSQPVIITPPPAEANQTSPENREFPGVTRDNK